MPAFLQLVAQDLRQKFGADLSRVVVVFPNKRAELFINDYLLGDTDTAPIWAPRYLTISDLFHSFSTLAVNDPIDTVCRLYRCYTERVEGAPSLDVFYGWAERILADFDDLDKNMADAKALFQNLSDLKTLEDPNAFLTDEQKEVLRTFFADFDAHQESEIRKNFLQIWHNLLPLYQQLNAELAAEGLAYEGALFRRVVEDLKQERIPLDSHVDCYAFVGFNVLDKVEEQLFTLLKKQQKALFYWDYDTFYLGTANQDVPFEAGLFLRENLLKFPNSLSPEHFDNLRHIEHIEMVAASTEVAQAQSVGPWLEAHLTLDPKRTAVVLCNENLLQPLLHALPENVREVNITKGFPLGHTEVATMVEDRLSDFEQHTTPLTTEQMLIDLIHRVNTAAGAYVQASGFSTEEFEMVLHSEAFYLMSTLLNRLLLIAQSGRLQVGPTALRRIVRQIVRQSTIPFQGEPAVGLQVMGVLETRCLDFESLILLSVNEGTLPQTSNDTSFIPYLLRKAFGLTTPERRTAVYAYYFYRLIQRAKHVRLLYNSSSEGLVQGEMSRFMTQLLIDHHLPITHKVLTGQQETMVRHPQPAAKPDHLLQILSRPTADSGDAPVLQISPSALNTYLRCELQFFYKYVQRIKEAKPDEGEIQPNILGLIFHTAAENIYKDTALLQPPNAPLSKTTSDLFQQGKRIDLSKLKALAANTPRLKAYVEQAYRQVAEDEGLQQPTAPLLESNVVMMFLRSLLLYDGTHGDLRVLGLEHHVSLRLPLPEGVPAEVIEIGGFIDRLDVVEEDGRSLLRIVDYKTGGKTETTSTVRDLFDHRGLEHKHYMMQTFIYALILHELSPITPMLPIAPTLFFVNHARNPSFTPYLKLGGEHLTDFARIADDFRKHLTQLIAEVLDPSRPFRPTDDTRTCTSCPYYALCYQ